MVGNKDVQTNNDSIKLDILQMIQEYKYESEDIVYLEEKEEKLIPYIFVSFDLTNSTKLKHETESWEKVVSELFNSMPLVRSYLNFWKFNGDELLFYKEVRSIYQIVAIIDSVNDVMHKISDNLSMQRTQDITGKSWYRIDVKATIWIAGIDFKNNFRINPPFGYDFIGKEIDEGFRLTKLATKGKCVIDPKIALLLSGFNAVNNDSVTTAELHKYFEIFENEFKNDSALDAKANDGSTLDTSKKSSSEKAIKYQTYYNLPHALFARNYISFFDKIFSESGTLKDKLKNADLNTKSAIKECADRMKLVGYSVCKGIWDEQDYPIIWYSKNWTRLDKEIAYDEKIGNEEISKERINKYYKNVDEDGYGIVTYLLLENIYRNTPSFSNSLNRILQLSKLKFSTEPTMFRYSVQNTNTYYNLVCYLEETDSVLMFLRSPARGHLANVWDFCCQKHLLGMGEKNGDLIFKSSIKKRYGIDVTISTSFTDSLDPIALKPVYRNGYYNQGIVCFAKIDTSSYLKDSNNNIEEKILNDINNAITTDISLDDYPYYTKARFIKRSSIQKTDNGIEFNLENEIARQISYEEERIDSKNKNYKIPTNTEGEVKFISDTKEILYNIFEKYGTKTGDK